MALLNFNKHLDSNKARERAELQAQISRVMAMVANDDLNLLECVGAGPAHWRTVFLRAFQGWPVNADVADRVFHFFCLKVQEKWGQTPVNRLLDSMEVRTPPTQREIDEAWVVDSASSDEGRRYCYGVDGSPLDALKRPN